MNTKDLGTLSFGVTLGADELDDTLKEMGSSMAGIWMEMSQEDQQGFVYESILNTEVFLSKLKLIKGKYFES